MSRDEWEQCPQRYSRRFNSMILFRMIEVRAIIQHITARRLAHAHSLLLDVASATPCAPLQRTVCTPTAHQKAGDLPDRDRGQDATS